MLFALDGCLTLQIVAACVHRACARGRGHANLLWGRVFEHRASEASSLLARVSKTSVELDVGVYRGRQEGDDVLIVEMGHLGISGETEQRGRPRRFWMRMRMLALQIWGGRGASVIEYGIVDCHRSRGGGS